MRSKSLITSVKIPNFLFIGPDKSGSTWLYNLLKNHPQVYLPKTKELFYFDYFYEKGDKWYFEYFKDVKLNHKIISEISHDYLFSEDACNRIKNTLPDVKLMVCFREPVERAFSSYLYLLKQGRTSLPFSEAIRNIDELVDHGLYYKHFHKYYHKFDTEKILWKLFDELKLSPEKLAIDIYDFLGIDKIPLSTNMKKKILPAASPRNYFISKTIHKTAWKIRELGYPQLLTVFKKNKFINLLLFQNFNDKNKPKIQQNDKDYLKNIFIQDLSKLSKLLNFNFIKYWGYDE